MSGAILPGTQWLVGNRIVEVDGPHTVDAVYTRDVATGELRPVRVSDLKPLPAAIEQAGMRHIPEEQWRRATAMANELRPFLDKNRLPMSAAEAIAKAFETTVRQVQRHRQAFQRSGGKTSSLVPQTRGVKPGSRRLRPEVEHIIADVITEHFECREPASKAKLVERIRVACHADGLPKPHALTVMARIRAREERALMTRQKGTKAARQVYEARPGALAVTRPMALVEIDHTQVDLQVVDAGGAKVGRPWLTLAIDVATRAVVGWYLTMNAPSAISVAMCVAHMLAPKPENAAYPGLWPMYGRPVCILVDNGKDFTSLAFQRGCEQHGIELRWRPLGKAHYGAHIERLMGTVMREVHTLPGTTFSRPHMRGDYPSEAKACLTLEDLRQWLITRICHGYHARAHRGLNGKTPLIAWEDGHRGAGGQIEMPPIPMDADTLHRDFYPFELRRLQRTGIQWSGSRYWHDDLGPYVGPSIHIALHFDPQDISRAWARLPDGRLVEVRPVAGRAITGPKYVPTREEESRLNDMLASGYAASDETVRKARKVHRRTAREPEPRALEDHSDAMPPWVPPTQRRLDVEMDDE